MRLIPCGIDINRNIQGHVNVTNICCLRNLRLSRQCELHLSPVKLMPSIFHAYTRPTGKCFAYFGPFGPDHLIPHQKLSVFVHCPRLLIYIWSQIVFPPVTALASRSSGNAISDPIPLVCPVLFNKGHQLLVLFRRKLIFASS